MNGLFLIALGLCCKYIVLPTWAETTAVLAAITGTYANWAVTLLSAFTGAAAMMPIAGGGSVGSPLHESVVSGLLVFVSLSMVRTCILPSGGCSVVHAPKRHEFLHEDLTPILANVL